MDLHALTKMQGTKTVPKQCPVQHIEGGAGFSIPPEWSLITSVRYGRMTNFSRMIDKSAHFPQMTDESAHFPRMTGKSMRDWPLPSCTPLYQSNYSNCTGTSKTYSSAADR